MREGAVFSLIPPRSADPEQAPLLESKSAALRDLQRTGGG
ncbi:hypothetical protein ABIE21_003494 [Conyzicola nivalis]|uniref:Uncharacterized protein n=1 Tax=Conyzicola nivalis TaxID=1477021 RepID=A0ABV2QU05_9MICO